TPLASGWRGRRRRRAAALREPTRTKPGAARGGSNGVQFLTRDTSRGPLDGGLAPSARADERGIADKHAVPRRHAADPGEIRPRRSGLRRAADLLNGPGVPVRSRRGHVAAVTGGDAHALRGAVDR